MQHEIKVWADATGHEKLKKLIESHVRKLVYSEDNKHLIVYVDNTAAMHSLEDKDMDKHVQKSLEKVYDMDSTYEFKLLKHGQTHDRENAVPRNIH